MSSEVLFWCDACDMPARHRVLVVELPGRRVPDNWQMPTRSAGEFCTQHFEALCLTVDGWRVVGDRAT